MAAMLSRRRVYEYAALLLLTAAGCATTLAQPVGRELFDANGVDLASGQHTFSQLDIDIGPPEANLSYSRSRSSAGSLNLANTDVFLAFPQGGGAEVSIGWMRERFDGYSSTFYAQNGMGSTLDFDMPSQTYVYTSRNGTVIRFPAPTANEDWLGVRALSILRPDGTLTEFSNRKWDCNNAFFWCSRVQSVANNAGYQLKLEYGDPVLTSAPTKVSVLNRGSAYCDPAANTCAATSGAPSVTLAWTRQDNGPSNPLDTAILTATDAAGRQTRWTIDAPTYGFGAKSPSSTADDTIVAFETFGQGPLGPVGGVTSVTRRGMTWDYQILEYSTSTPTIRVTDPLGNSREIKTNILKAEVMTYKDELGRITAYLYDSFGRRTRITYPEGNYVQFAYDGRGNVTEARQVAKSGSPAVPDIVVSATYPAACSNPKTCNKPSSTTDARGYTTDYTYDPTHGGVLTVTAPAPFGGAVRPQTRFTYTPLYAWYKNSAGTIVQAATPIYKLTGVSSCQTVALCENSAEEVKTTFTYQSGSSSTPSNLLLLSVTQSSGNNSASTTTTMSYDDRGNRVAVDGPLAGAVDTITSRYDVLRRVVGVVGPDPDGSGPLLRRAMRLNFNLDGQPTAVDRGTVNGLSESDWSAFSMLEQASIGYDAAGRRTSVSLKHGGSTSGLAQYSYDAASRLDCVAVRMNPAAFGSSPGSACTLGAPGSFGPDRITKSVYDARGRVTKVQTGYGTHLQRDETSATYSENGRVLSVSDARAGVTTYEYDRYDRLYKTRYPSSPGSSSATDFEQFTYDLAGNPIEIRLRDGQILGFTYDAIGRVATRDLPGSELDVTYGYDNLGRATSISQSGHALTFGYDALGNLLTQTGPQGTLTSAYDAAGRRERVTWPDAFFVEYKYHVTGEMTDIRENGATSGIGVLAQYTYDNLGRRTTLARGNGAITHYEYNSASRLEQLRHDLAATAADQIVGMSYNPVGQISTRTSSNDAYLWAENQPVSRSYSVNSLNQYTAIGAVVPTYDARGNLTNSGAGAYGYSSENLLTSAPGGVSLSYDPVGRLYQTSVAGATTRFAYDGGQLVSEYNSSNQLMRRYVHGASVDEPLVWYEGTGTATRRWLHADERGSIVAISDAAGAQFAINQYDEHGVPASTNTGRFQFTGQAWIDEVDLYYFKARFYSPALGRFMQADPIGYAAGMNMYSYVRGDVVNLRDPSGLSPDGPDSANPVDFADWERLVDYNNMLLQEYLNSQLLVFNGAVSGACLNGNGACHRTPLPPVDVDWTGVANDWWPGYQVGTCIYEGCSGGKWILGAIGAWPGGKAAVTGTSLLARGALSATSKNLLRVAAADIWRVRMGRSAAEMGMEVHHRIPLEWAHLTPNLDPNRAANLIGVPAVEHWRITAAWNQWRVNLGGRVPTQAELEGFASGIDMAFFDVMTRLP